MQLMLELLVNKYLYKIKSAKKVHKSVKCQTITIDKRYIFVCDYFTYMHKYVFGHVHI